MPDLNVVDYAVIAVLAVSGYMAIKRGFWRELLGLAGWIISFFVAGFFRPVFVDRFGDAIGNDATADLLGFLVPFVLAAIICKILSNALAPRHDRISIGSMDQILGFLFGIVRGAVLVTLVYIAGLLLLEREERFPENVLSSASIAPVRIIGSQLAYLAPGGLGELVEGRIPEQDIGPLLDPARNAADRASDTLLPDERLPQPGDAN